MRRATALLGLLALAGAAAWLRGGQDASFARLFGALGAAAAGAWLLLPRAPRWALLCGGASAVGAAAALVLALHGALRGEHADEGPDPLAVPQDEGGVALEQAWRLPDDGGGTVRARATGPRPVVRAPEGVRVEVENRGDRPAPADGPVRFLAWGDCRGGVTVQERLADLVRARRPDFVVGLGDFVGMARTYQFEILRDRFEATGVPFFAVPGNHDLDPFGTLRPYARVFGARRWSFLERGVLFVGLDTARGSIEPEDARWLVGVVEAAREAMHHLVLCLHHPLWAPADRPDKPLPQDDAATRLVQGLCARWRALVLSSHWHGWEARDLGNGVTQVVTGGAGSRLEAEVPYHAVEVTFSPDGPRVERVDLGRAGEVSERVDRWKTFRDEAAWAARHRPLAVVPAFLLLALGLAGLARAAAPRPKASAA